MMADSLEYGRVTGAGRADAEPAFVDAWQAAGNEPDPGYTFLYPPEQCDRRDKRIDYCFVCSKLADRIRKCWIDTEAEGSDHQPIWTELACK